MADNTFTLLVEMPGQAPLQHELASDLTNVGRGPDNHLQILVSEVSVKHAQVKKEGDAVKILELGSTNGTKVNGVRIDTSGRVLEAMDQLLFGETVKAYFVPTAMLAATPAAELIASLAAESKAAAKPKTAPVAVAVKPAPVAAAGGATVRLDQVRPAAPGPVAPKPGGGPPAVAPGPPKVAPGPPKVAPGPPKVAPGGPQAPAPPSPGAPPAAPRPVAPVPLQRPAPGAPPSVPLPPSPPKPGGA